MASDATRTVGGYASMLDALLEGFQVIGFDYRYLVVNAAAARHGRSSADRLIGRTIMACYPGIDQTPMFEKLRDCLEQRRSHVMENHFRCPDGSGAHFERRIEPVPQGACVLRVQPPVGNVEADPAQLEKVVRNLVHNARDAMPRGGLIAIELAELAFDADYVRMHPGTHEGRHVAIAVSDTGEGMDLQTQARILQPFFSTKERRRGSGLGLSTVYGIVQQSGGHIWVYIEPGRGTSFKVYLPSLSPSPRDRSPASRPPLPPPERIEVHVLIAEDDALLRTMAEHTLQGAGYRALSARSGDQALAMIKAGPSILVLVTDVVMPGLCGPELIAQARAARPELKVPCTSGYALSALEDHKAALENVTSSTSLTFQAPWCVQ